MSFSLNLSEKGLTEFPDLSNYDYIEELVCSGNFISYIPISHLPISLISLDISCNMDLKELPDLSKLKNLRKLNCSCNVLTKLPKLPTSLRILNCSHNFLTELRDLPILFELNCTNNKLVELPDMYDLSIWGNINLYIICYPHNTLPYKELNRECINKTNKILRKFRYTFYSMKFKNKFRNWLWEKVRLPKVQTNYHPSNLRLLLNDVNEDDSEKFDKVIEDW
jgi:Leucine-rich repeat (LRR) protein